MGTKGKTALIISICTAAFTGGLLVGFIRSRTRAEAEPVTQEPTVMERAESADFIVPETEYATPAALSCDYYLIRLTGDDIVIYEVFTNGTKSEVERMETESSALRKEDIELLSEGIKAYSRDEAMMLTEDFIS